MIVACIALFVALGGTAIAANHYLITSVGQISPKVRKKLTGPAGAQGPAGAAGKNGTNGTNGNNGTPGAPGAPGKPGADGSARAYATVNAAGAFTGNGKSTGSAERRFEGVYCVSFGGGIAPSNSLIFAFPIYEGNKVFLQYDPSSNDECQGTNQFAIEAHDAAGNLKNTAFMVMVS